LARIKDKFMPNHSSVSDASGRVLSIVIPIYNERDTWREILRRVEEADAAGLAKQIVLVEDGSKDGTREQLREFAEKFAEKFAEGRPAPEVSEIGPVSHKVVFHERNRGKGAALRTGFAAADGDFVIVQDADLEYDPGDYPALLRPLLAGRACAVYGTRFAAGRPPSSRRRNYVANRSLTWLANRVMGVRLTDMETCYKVLPRDILRELRLEQDRFGFEPEITACLAGLGVDIVEVPIRYTGRSHEEGKKIGWKDGFKTLWCILKYGLPARFRRGNAARQRAKRG
jgi:glycosyltransferase involved in cell wall biosynthesis